jgi:hypothetical protein
MPNCMIARQCPFKREAFCVIVGALIAASAGQSAATKQDMRERQEGMRQEGGSRITRGASRVVWPTKRPILGEAAELRKVEERQPRLPEKVGE